MVVVDAGQLFSCWLTIGCPLSENFLFQNFLSFYQTHQTNKKVPGMPARAAGCKNWDPGCGSVGAVQCGRSWANIPKTLNRARTVRQLPLNLELFPQRSAPLPLSAQSGRRATCGNTGTEEKLGPQHMHPEHPTLTQMAEGATCGCTGPCELHHMQWYVTQAKVPTGNTYRRTHAARRFGPLARPSHPGYGQGVCSLGAVSGGAKAGMY